MGSIIHFYYVCYPMIRQGHGINGANPCIAIMMH